MGTNTPTVIDNYNPILSPRKADKLPDYVYTNVMTMKAYKYATEHTEVLEQIPYYCGCESMVAKENQWYHVLIVETENIALC